MKKGFDVPTIKRISDRSSIPIIAHGGAGNINHVLNLVRNTKVSGVALSSLLHYDIAHTFKKPFFKLGNLNYLQSLKKKQKRKKIFYT